MLEAAHSVRIVVGGSASLAAVRSIARLPGDELLLDAFKLTDPEPAHEVAGAARRGHVGVLADPEFMQLQHRELLRGAGAAVVDYGLEPAKNHGKGIVARTPDGHRGAITTAALIPESAGRFDLTALLDEPSSVALRDLLHASMYGTDAQVHAAAAAAELRGIVINDPLRGIATLRDGVDGLVGGARDRLLVATKKFADQDTVSNLAERAGDDVAVELATRTVRKADRRELRAAGVAVHELGIEGGSMHANAIVADGRAYLGTAYLHHRPLGRGNSIRLPRELGVITDDPSAVAAIERAIRDRIALG